MLRHQGYRNFVALIIIPIFLCSNICVAGHRPRLRKVILSSSQSDSSESKTQVPDNFSPWINSVIIYDLERVLRSLDADSYEESMEEIRSLVERLGALSCTSTALASKCKSVRLILLAPLLEKAPIAPSRASKCLSCAAPYRTTWFSVGVVTMIAVIGVTAAAKGTTDESEVPYFLFTSLFTVELVGSAAALLICILGNVPERIWLRSNQRIENEKLAWRQDLNKWLEFDVESRLSNADFGFTDIMRILKAGDQTAIIRIFFDSRKRIMSEITALEQFKSVPTLQPMAVSEEDELD